MAVAEDQTTNPGQDEGLGRGAALKAAGAAAATGAAALVVQKALASRGRNGGESEGDEEGEGKREKQKQEKSGKRPGSGSSLFQSAASGGWEAARDTLVPLAEDAAGAAGTYVAEHSPEFVTERLVPRFIESFNKAKG